MYITIAIFSAQKDYYDELYYMGKAFTLSHTDNHYPSGSADLFCLLVFYATKLLLQYHLYYKP